MRAIVSMCIFYCVLNRMIGIKIIYCLLVAHPGFIRGQLFLRISIFKPSLNNYEPNDIFFIQIGRAVLEF